MVNGKKGLDYYSHDTDSTQDKKLKLLMAKYDLIGYAVFYSLLEKIYSENFYILADDDFSTLFIGDHKSLDEKLYVEILKECLRVGLFDLKLYKAFNILTSARIQRNYFEAAKRRKRYFVQSELILAKADEIPSNVHIIKEDVNSGRAESINSDKESIPHVGKEKQSKVKESKVKESKEKVHIDEQKFYRSFDHLSITAFEVMKLRKFGYTKEEIDHQIDRLENYTENKRYKTIYLTVLNWLKVDDEKKGVKRNLPPATEVKNDTEIIEDDLTQE